jgi:Fe2+ or Zn2+ uptake regulation protein
MTVDEVRSTPQRRAVLDVIAKAADHPTAAEVLDRVCEILPGVGAATVYRTLGMLVESGHIAELRLGTAAARYDREVGHHDHLICDNCGAVVDVHAELDRHAVIDPLETRHRFRATGYDLRIHGSCAACSKANTHRKDSANV